MVIVLVDGGAGGRSVRRRFCAAWCADMEFDLKY